MTTGRPVARLVALDLDGTVLDHEEKVSDRVLAAVRALAASPIEVVVATGRSVNGTLPVLDRLGLRHGWTVCSNGAVLLELDPSRPRGFRIERAETFRPTEVLDLLRRHLPDARFALEDGTDGFVVTRPFPEGELTGPYRVLPFEELRLLTGTRVIVRSPERSSAEFLDLVPRLGLHGVSYAVGWTAWLDLAPEGVSKATALERVRERVGVPAAGTLALGDGRNDLEMFAWAGRSVAMGQAPQDVREAAGEVAPGVDEDGVAVVLEELLRDLDGGDAGRPAGPA